jgi:hypothetical protein
MRGPLPFAGRRIGTAALLVAIGVGLAGCETSDMMDKAQETIADFNPFGTKKQPLPGQRREVFPQGVPGVQQGVPSTMMKGAQQIPDPNAPAVIEAAPEPAAAEEKSKPKPKARVARPRPTAPPAEAAAPKPVRAARKPAAPAAQSQQPADDSWPAPAEANQPAASSAWPSATQQPAAPTVWPDPPKAGTFTR